MFLSAIIILIYSYLLGSFPTAYVLLKRKGLNITEEGSGNVGALNASRVGSKATGMAVFVIDALKGFAAVQITILIFGNSFLFASLALLGAVTGHCFSIWLKFKGGRGLATAFGGALPVAAQVPLLWVILWLIAFAYKKNVHFSNASATFLLILLVIFSGKTIAKYSVLKPETASQFTIIVSLILFVILIKHYKPIKEYFTAQKNIGRFHE